VHDATLACRGLGFASQSALAPKQLGMNRLDDASGVRDQEDNSRGKLIIATATSSDRMVRVFERWREVP
jgi:hypothetical protein